MRALRQLGGGLVLGLISATVVVGGISLALAEGYVPPPRPTSTPTQPVDFSLQPTQGFPTPFDFQFTPYPSDTPSVTPTPPINCPPPSGWMLITVGPTDTLESLAARYKTTAAALSAANCLVSASLLPGYGIYVPPMPTNTAIPCGPPPGWVQYTVQPNDTLFHISQLYRVTVSQLQQANCLGSSTTIYAGQRLWAPNVATSTPIATPISIEFATVTPIPTNTATPTATGTATPTLPPTATNTTVPPTETPTPTPTATGTNTPPTP